MRFLADENCDFAVVLALRAAGHDVLAAVDLGERSVDALLLEMAHQEGRILLTEDKDRRGDLDALSDWLPRLSSLLDYTFG
jgi:predicted nuclease of predicted toxin-antitoxin system